MNQFAENCKKEMLPAEEAGSTTGLPGTDGCHPSALVVAEHHIEDRASLSFALESCEWSMHRYPLHAAGSFCSQKCSHGATFLNGLVG
jgi:hypothetical protein